MTPTHSSAHGMPIPSTPSSFLPQSPSLQLWSKGPPYEQQPVLWTQPAPNPGGQDRSSPPPEKRGLAQQRRRGQQGLRVPPWWWRTVSSPSTEGSLDAGLLEQTPGLGGESWRPGSWSLLSSFRGTATGANRWKTGVQGISGRGGTHHGGSLATGLPPPEGTERQRLSSGVTAHRAPARTDPPP